MLVLILGLCGFASAAIGRAADPLVTTIARDFSVPVATAALLSSAFALPYALGQPVLGPLGDFYGKGTILKACLVALILCMIGTALAPSFPVLMALRPLAGVAAGGLIPVALAILGDRSGPHERQLVIGRFLTTSLMGQVIGSSGAGFLADLIGWRGVFALCGLIATAALAGAHMMFRPAPVAARPRFSLATALGGYRRVFRNRNALFCFGVVFVEGATIFGVGPFFAAMLEETHTGGAREAGIILAGIGVGGICYLLLLGRILRLLTRRRMMAIGGTLAALGLATVGLRAGWMVDAAGYSLTGFGYFMLHNSIQTEVSELAPDARASAFALHAFSLYAGQAVSPILFAGLRGLAGTGPTLWLEALVLACAGYVASIMIRPFRDLS